MRALLVLLLCGLAVVSFFATMAMIGNGQVVGPFFAFSSMLTAVYLLMNELKAMAEGR